MSTLPIGKPLGLYPGVNSQLPMLSHRKLKYNFGEIVLEEPQLLATDVAWQPIIEPFPSTPAAELGALFDRKQLGGKLTVCVFCQGDRVDTHRQCLDSIVKTIPVDRLDLRIGGSGLGTESLLLLRSLPVSKIYLHEQRAKYQLMRDMLWDDELPIQSNYVAWFDDEARVSHANWLNLLANEILKQPTDIGMFGIKLYYPFQPQKGDPRRWFQSADWYRGKFFRSRQGSPVPNGDTVHFCDDWFWVASMRAIRDCNIPCPRVTSAGGAIVVGEQLHQGSYKIKQFNAGKALVYVSKQSQSFRTTNSSLPYPWQTG